MTWKRITKKNGQSAETVVKRTYVWREGHGIMDLWRDPAQHEEARQTDQFNNKHGVFRSNVVSADCIQQIVGMQPV